MARDAELLAICEKEGVAARVYTWSEPWVTLGRFQKPISDIKLDSPVPYVMRPTGGRAVLHGHDITIGLAISLSSMAKGGEEVTLLSRSVRRVYRVAVLPIIYAFRSCGIDAVLGEELRGIVELPKSADCFAHVSANDVVDRKALRKVCGVAMLLTRDAVLLQASVPIAEPLIDPALVYEKPAKVFPVSITMLDFAREFQIALCSGARNLSISQQ